MSDGSRQCEQRDLAASEHERSAFRATPTWLYHRGRSELLLLGHSRSFVPSAHWYVEFGFVVVGADGFRLAVEVPNTRSAVAVGDELVSLHTTSW